MKVYIKMFDANVRNAIGDRLMYIKIILDYQHAMLKLRLDKL